MSKPLTVTLDSLRGRLVREAAQAQGVTYLSLVHAALDHALFSGRSPLVLEPFGGEGKEEAKIAEKTY